MRLIVALVITALSILLAAEIVAGIEVTSFWKALIAAFAISVLNVTIKPIVVILTLPITILTLGIFYFVLNGLFFAFVAVFVDGFEVTSVIAAILGALIVSLGSMVGNNLMRSTDK